MNYQKILSRAKNEKASINQTIGTLIIFHKEEIVNKVRTRWVLGKDPNGGIIGTYRNKDYRAFKVVANSKANGLVDLTLTGALGNKLTVRKKGNKEFEIFSTDWKFEHISEKYGLEQFNLSAEQQQDLFNMLFVKVLEKYLLRVWLV